jgi:hypothetical protein
MPPLPHPKHNETIQAGTRAVRVAGDADVLVVGGGPAGIGAAVGAARAGARTILVERYGFVGGNATAGLVSPLMSYFTEHHTRQQKGAVSLLPTDHGQGVPVIAGVLRELIDRLERAGGATEPSLETGYTVPFDPEVFKQAAVTFLDDAGVRYLFHSLAAETLRTGRRVDGVVFETKSGPLAIRAAVTVDCTGDGDTAASGGAAFELGRSDGYTQPMTLMFRVLGFDKAAFGDYAGKHPGQWRGVHGLWDLVKKAAKAGELDLQREDILFFTAMHEGEITVNSTRVTKLFGTDVWDLTEAEWQSRRQMQQIFQFLKKYVPGFEHAYIVQSGVQVGVRETRRVVGEYTLSKHDVLCARQFDDVIARCTYPMDIHNPKGKGTTMMRVPAGKAYDIPLRCLLPKRRRQSAGGGTVYFGDARGLFVIPDHAGLDGHRAGGGRLCGAGGDNQADAAIGALSGCAARIIETAGGLARYSRMNQV